MSTMESTNIIRQSLVQSNLHYFLNESPHSIWITIRKRLINPNQSFSSIPTITASENDTFQHARLYKIEEQHEILKEKYAKLERAFDSLQSDYATEISEHEVVIKEKNELKLEGLKKDGVIENLKGEIYTLNNELESIDTNVKKNSKEMKVKDKELHDIKKENSKVKEDLAGVTTELKELRCKVTKEEKQQQRKMKFKEKKDLLNNLKSESNPLELQCDICEESFETTGKLKLHVQTAHHKHVTTQTDDKTTETKIVQTLTKSTCEKDVQTTDENMFVKINNYSDPMKKYPCSDCENTFNNDANLQCHRHVFHGTHVNFSPIQNMTNIPFGFPPVGFPSSSAIPSWLPPYLPR